MRQRGVIFVSQTREREREILRLLQLEEGKEQIESIEFQDEVSRAKTYVSVWKRKYGYSSNDPRYLTATYTQILRDLLEDNVYDYLYRFERFDDDTNEFVRKRELDPGHDQKEAEEITELLNRAITGGRTKKD